MRERERKAPRWSWKCTVLETTHFDEKTVWSVDRKRKKTEIEMRLPYMKHDGFLRLVQRNKKYRRDRKDIKIFHVFLKEMKEQKRNVNHTFFVDWKWISPLKEMFLLRNTKKYRSRILEWNVNWNTDFILLGFYWFFPGLLDPQTRFYRVLLGFRWASIQSNSK